MIKYFLYVDMFYFREGLPMATKNEWQEYFELMNDRKPTIEETTAAQAAGEFEAEVVAEPVATSAQPEVTAQPTAPV